MKYSIKQRPSFSSPHPRLYPVRVWFDKLTMTCTGGDFAAPAQRSFQRLQAIRSFIYPSSSAAFLNGVATRYFFANYELETTATEETQIVYYYVNGAQIAQRKITASTDKLLYIHKDHLGSAVRLTDESGTVVQSLAYDPFGQTVYNVGISEPSRQYTGQIKDGTGLYYYGARYYDPELGRFISPDSFLDGLNRYAYCRNNPVRYVDPSGNETDENGFFDEENFIAGMENLDALYENADWWNYADDIAEDGWVAINPPGKSGKTAPEVINPTKEEDRPIIEIPERDDGFIFDYVNDHCCPV